MSLIFTTKSKDINPQKNNTLDINIDEFSDFSIILGFGNFTPFVYIKTNEIFSNFIKKQEYYGIDIVNNVTNFPGINNIPVFGPFNLLEIKSFYKKNVINSTTMVKFIDIIRFKNFNKNNSPYFPLSIFKNKKIEDIILEIEIETSLLTIGENLKTKQKFYISKKEEQQKMFKTNEELKDKDKTNNDNIQQQNLTTKIIENGQVLINIKEEDNKNKFEDNNIDYPIDINYAKYDKQPVICKKKKKAKTKEIDTKLGFYSMSKEEQNYCQHYTAK